MADCLTQSNITTRRMHVSIPLHSVHNCLFVFCSTSESVKIVVACLSGVSHRCLLHSHACVCIGHLVWDPSHHIDISQCCYIITHSYSISYTHFHRLLVVLHHTPSSNIPTLSLPSTTPTSHSPTLTHFTFYIIFYRFRRYYLINSHFNIVTTSFSTTQIQIVSNF